MDSLTVAFDAVPFARWGPLFHVLRLEHPELHLHWRPQGFPAPGECMLDGADVGLFVEPPEEPGISALTIESSQMVVLMAAGHRLARSDELRTADILDQAFPGGPHHEEWRKFWTLDEQRGGPPPLTDDLVENADDGLAVVASGRAIGTVAASFAAGFAHPGVIAVPLADGPPVRTRLVWRCDDDNPIIESLVSLASDMTRGDRGDAMSA
jgi:DNA-binding transcriptional LysR family regulator